jgi:hypothetical protein
MKELNRYNFANGKAFSTRLLDADDQRRLSLPECDVIAMVRTDDKDYMLAMRPDEALILARLLIDAVEKVTGGRETNESKSRTITCYDQSGELPPVTIKTHNGKRVSVLEKHVLCCHDWKIRDDSDVCRKCDLVRLRA